MAGIRFPGPNISSTLCDMQSSRDSSLLRSLAVAFGDGLAFGAGMKLTQRALRAQAPASSAPITPGGLLEKLDDLEKRLIAAELATSARAIAAPPAFDPKVLEALTTALDARLEEQAAEIDHRIAAFDGKMALELKALQQQDHSVASGIQAHLE